ncbi:hypothetical protein AZH53_07170 [Methanomicrobiaceae archaeon CYW5]|uniref:response regulator n=1 Tax=Methanovulcanius yangii TaxID=1789227 RepID=UPI0029CA8386|nr:response regulator [Methanovulcanius yangii]MBT8508184.1 hypothetical protein [Methanovulcanius yangii]
MPETTRKILVMDDEPTILEVTCLLLGRLGYETVAATSGEDALEQYRDAMAENASFDAVILDITVPGGMGAMETIPLLWEIDPGVRAIVTSGLAGDMDESSLLEMGFAGVLKKPYRMYDLRDILDQTINS